MTVQIAKHRSKLLLFISIIFLLFFRARWAFNISYVDETCYLESLHKLIGMDYPVCYLKTHLPGVVLSWVPVAALAQLLHGLTSFSFDEWLMPLLGIFSFVCWGFALFQIDSISQRWGVNKIFFPKSPWLFSMLFLLNIPVLDFATQLTTMAHATELAVAFLILNFCNQNRFYLAIFLTIWLSVIRLNDLPIILMIVGSMVDGRTIRFSKSQQRNLIGLLILACSLIGGIAFWLGVIQGHANMKITTLANSISFSALKQVLFSPIESLFLYLPFWSLAFVSGIFFWKKLSLTAKAGLFWMLGVFLFNVGHRGYWKTDGPHFRFFLGSYVAVLQIVLELYKTNSQKSFRIARWILCFGAIWYSLFVWSGGDAYNWTRLYLFEGGLGATYSAYDGSNMPAHLRKLVVEPLGLSPIVFSVFSWVPNASLFSKFSNMQKYAIHGPALWVLSMSSLLALLIAVKIAKGLKK